MKAEEQHRKTVQPKMTHPEEIHWRVLPASSPNPNWSTKVLFLNSSKMSVSDSYEKPSWIHFKAENCNWAYFCFIFQEVDRAFFLDKKFLTMEVRGIMF